MNWWHHRNASPEEKKRRKHLHDILAEALRLVDEACKPIDDAAALAGKVADAVKKVKEVDGVVGVHELLRESTLSKLREANQLFDEAHGKVDQAEDVCKKLKKAIKFADNEVVPNFPWTNLGIATGGVVVAATVIAVGVILSNSVTILVTNQNCTIDFSAPGVLNAASQLPGIEVPSSLPIGGTRRIQVPMAFTGTAELTQQQIIFHDHVVPDVTINWPRLDLANSKWDGISVSSLEGKEIPLDNKASHTLLLVCP